jgi:hypothetical protein
MKPGAAFARAKTGTGNPETDVVVDNAPTAATFNKFSRQQISEAVNPA